MDATPLLFDLPPVPDRSRGAIRDKILAFLDQPRSARDIATHIERTVPNATGHLSAARKLGLVVRVGWGRYVRADRCPDRPDNESIRRPNSEQDLLLRVAGKAHSLDDLVRLTGRTPHRLRQVVARMQARGRDLPANIVTALEEA